MKIVKEVKYIIEFNKIDVEVIRQALNFAISRSYFTSKSEYEEKANDLHHLLFQELTNA